MDRFWPTAVIIVVVVLVFVAMWIGWRRRARRDAGLVVPDALARPGAPILSTEALHVGSTHHDRPLDRVIVPGLAFRAKAAVDVSEGGVTITSPGESTVAIAASALIGVGTATWTIDRSVEQDGLVLVAWRTGTADASGDVIDTYLRVADARDQSRLVASIHSLIGESSTSGADDVAHDTNTGSEA
jgi:hypothetical protein